MRPLSRTLGALIDELAAARPEADAVVFRGERLSFAALRGRAYLGAIHDVVPELARAEPGALRSERLPELRVVVSIDERRHDGVYAWADFLRRAGDARESALTAAQATVGPSDLCFVLYT